MQYDTEIRDNIKNDPLGFVDMLKCQAPRVPKQYRQLLEEAASVIANLLLTKEDWRKLDTKYLVLKTMCHDEQNWEGIKCVVSSSKNIAESLGISQYAALKALHQLMYDGLVEHGSMGCPAEISGGEYEEVVHEAGPPINGFCLTEKGRKTAIYKNELICYTQTLMNLTDF